MLCARVLTRPVCLLRNCSAVTARSSAAAFSTSSARFERKYTKKHEWITVKDGVGTVGITDYAQEQLGDVVFVELPEVGKQVAAGDAAATVESVKAASDVYTPVSGTVTEANQTVLEENFHINKSPFDKGWLFKLKLKDASELKELLDEKAYEAFKKEEEAAH